MERKIFYESLFRDEKDSGKGILSKKLRLYWEHESLKIEVIAIFWSEKFYAAESVEKIYAAESVIFSKSWPFFITTILEKKFSYPENIDPYHMRELLKLTAESSEKSTAEKVIYNCFYELEIYPLFYNVDKFGEGWLKEHLPKLWEHWAERALFEREQQAEQVMEK